MDCKSDGLLESALVSSSMQTSPALARPLQEAGSPNYMSISLPPGLKPVAPHAHNLVWGDELGENRHMVRSGTALSGNARAG